MLTRHLAIVVLLGSTLSPLTIACGKEAPPAPVDDTRASQTQPNSATVTKSGVSAGQKVVLLAGAAALYYMYKHHQTAGSATGPESQYYLSKNGRVYYRDADHRAHWVTPPTEGVRVPESEAPQFRQFQGYDGSASGRDLTGISNDDE